METLLRINNASIAPLPDLMLENPLPPNLVVLEPLHLKGFANILGYLPLNHCSDYQTDYYFALRIALVGMLAAALTVDHW